ncbi:hypothetical protein CSIM01_13860 [Colletotrichum simmondsii]|uniref:F-box domain-containing protein n=1 Tax=Colletotrichum simmondsii TaxID=703756 RepID=A0A135THI7_9PEZI|nr:hypothetical protein CSIM01_13860 [Colletotrichum simmondsii]
MLSDISHLPVEMKLAVAEQLDRQSLSNMCQVSSDWLSLCLPLFLSKSKQPTKILMVAKKRRHVWEEFLTGIRYGPIAKHYGLRFPKLKVLIDFRGTHLCDTKWIHDMAIQGTLRELSIQQWRHHESGPGGKPSQPLSFYLSAFKTLEVINLDFSDSASPYWGEFVPEWPALQVARIVWGEDITVPGRLIQSLRCAPALQDLALGSSRVQGPQLTPQEGENHFFPVLSLLTIRATSPALLAALENFTTLHQLQVNISHTTSAQGLAPIKKLTGLVALFLMRDPKDVEPKWIRWTTEEFVDLLSAFPGLRYIQCEDVARVSNPKDMFWAMARQVPGLLEIDLKFGCVYPDALLTSRRPPLITPSLRRLLTGHTITRDCKQWEDLDHEDWCDETERAIDSYRALFPRLNFYHSTGDSCPENFD